MFTTSEAPVQHLPFAQAIELSLLVDLEARWENLRIYQPASAGTTSTPKDLHQKQKAYEAFFAKLGIYNKAHKPAHVAELLLNNPSRLGKWCWTMRDLVVQIQHDPQAQPPAHLLAKAYRWADRVAERMKRDRIARPDPSMSIPAAIQELEELARWCDTLSRVAG
jgi:hypothetical protein